MHHSVSSLFEQCFFNNTCWSWSDHTSDASILKISIWQRPLKKFPMGRLLPDSLGRFLTIFLPKTKSMLVKLWGTRLYCIGAQVQLPLVQGFTVHGSHGIFFRLHFKRSRIPPNKVQFVACRNRFPLFVNNKNHPPQSVQSRPMLWM